jgi:dynein light chain LC8-type
MKNYAFECAEISFRTDFYIGLMHKGEKRYFKDVAEFIKRSFDEKFQGSWHVIAGK